METMKLNIRWIEAVDVTPSTEKEIVEIFFKGLPQRYPIFSNDLERVTINGSLYILTEHYLDTGNSEHFLYTKKQYQ